ncbi:hypothetical protein ACRRTK_013959 [Alexandromys fortis]
MLHGIWMPLRGSQYPFIPGLQRSSLIKMSLETLTFWHPNPPLPLRWGPQFKISDIFSETPVSSSSV